MSPKIFKAALVVPLLFLGACASSKNSNFAMGPNTVKAPFLYCALNTPKPFFLLGTTHIESAKVLPNYLFEEVIKGSDMAFFESDVERPTSESIPVDQLIKKWKGESDPRKCTFQNISLASQNRLREMFPESFLSEYGCFPPQFFQAFLNMLLFTQALKELGRKGLTKFPLMDDELMKAARARGVTAATLDRFDHAKMPDLNMNASSLEALDKTIAEIDKVDSKQELTTFLKNYWNGDEKGLLKSGAHFDLLQAKESYLLGGRDREWLERIRPFLGGRIFIAVGLAHVLSPVGFRHFLEDKQKIRFQRVRERSDLKNCFR